MVLLVKCLRDTSGLEGVKLGFYTLSLLNLISWTKVFAFDLQASS